MLVREMIAALANMNPDAVVQIWAHEDYLGEDCVSLLDIELDACHCGEGVGHEHDVFISGLKDGKRQALVEAISAERDPELVDWLGARDEREIAALAAAREISDR